MRIPLASECSRIFQQSVEDYHERDVVDTPSRNPFGSDGIESLLYDKTWIDAVQWHLEDLVRFPDIDPVEALRLKRRIDRSNQDRTNLVERMDDWFAEQFKDVVARPEARINSETPAWLLDRMSILVLKIYHMREQAGRTDAGPDHLAGCRAKLETLLEQKGDLQRAFDELMSDIGSGRRRFKAYRQLKMYNDASLNPVLYAKRSQG